MGTMHHRMSKGVSSLIIREAQITRKQLIRALQAKKSQRLFSPLPVGGHKLRGKNLKQYQSISPPSWTQPAQITSKSIRTIKKPTWDLQDPTNEAISQVENLTFIHHPQHLLPFMPPQHPPPVSSYMPRNT